MSDLDPYSIYIPPAKQEDFNQMLDNSFRGVGIQLDMQDGKATVVTPIDGSPAFYAGVMAGDVILKVNGDSIEGLQLNDLVKKITGPVGTSVTLTLQHADGQIVDMTMKRQEIVLPTVLGYERAADDSWNYWVCKNPKIAYLRVSQFTDNTFDELHDALAGAPADNGKPAVPGLLAEGAKGLILDLRFNPGGRLDQAIKVVNMFVKEGVIVSTKGRARPESIVRATGEGTLPDFPIIVLVNEYSASAAEIVSGSLKDNKRALIIGVRTYGKGSVQELIPLDDDSGELKLTVAYYYLPSGRLVHRKKGATDWGVDPQINVPLDTNPELNEKAEAQLMEQFVEHETIRRSKMALHPTTQPFVDTQLQAAITSMVGSLILQGGGPPVDVASTPPTTAPAH